MYSRKSTDMTVVLNLVFWTKSFYYSSISLDHCTAVFILCDVMFSPLYFGGIVSFSTTVKPAPGHSAYDLTADDHELLQGVRDSFNFCVKDAKTPLFTTDTKGLYDLFLSRLPAGLRQTYNCRACRAFVETYGGLATIDSFGNTTPVMWPRTDPSNLFYSAVVALRNAVQKAPVTGVFLSSEGVWGKPSNTHCGHTWQHFAVTPPFGSMYSEVLLTAEQAMAEKLQDYEMLQRGLKEFSLPVIQQAHTLLNNGQIYRPEKALGVATWFLDLKTTLAGLKPARRPNVIWLWLATAPAGFCHIRSGMIGTLLEDIQAEVPFETISRKWAEKMNPTQYMRPMATPSAGNINQAERIIQKLQTEGALDRRFARLSEIQTAWRPTARHRKVKPEELGQTYLREKLRAAGHDVALMDDRKVLIAFKKVFGESVEIRDGMIAVDYETTKPGVFGHLRTQGITSGRTSSQPSVQAFPVTTMTWEKFQRKVLPEASSIEYYVPAGRKLSLAALVTAGKPMAPPMIQWDTMSCRNPVSWYLYATDSMPSTWGLSSTYWTKVNAIALKPSMWSGKTPNQVDGLILILDGCKDMHYNRGAGLFPEILKSEYHPIRATLEAHFKQAVIAGKEQSDACGLMLEAGQLWPDVTLRVTTKTGTTTQYKLDRWD